MTGGLNLGLGDYRAFATVSISSGAMLQSPTCGKAMDGLVRLATDASQALSSPDSAGTVGQLLRDRGITGRT
ncbi:MAG: hypothetical protein QXM81_05195, partial [Nitrososphaerota archaeon]